MKRKTVNRVANRSDPGVGVRMVMVVFLALAAGVGCDESENCVHDEWKALRELCELGTKVKNECDQPQDWGGHDTCDDFIAFWKEECGPDSNFCLTVESVKECKERHKTPDCSERIDSLCPEIDNQGIVWCG